MASPVEKSDLAAPLIPKELDSDPSQSEFSRDDIISETKLQLYLAGPMMFVNLLLSLIQTISVMFVGHVSDLALSGASMATSFASVTGFSLLVNNKRYETLTI